MDGSVRRVLRTGETFLTEKQQARLDVVFADPAHADVWRAWRVYQQVVAAYREKFSGLGRKRLRELIDVVRHGLPSFVSSATRSTAAVRTSSRTLTIRGPRTVRPKRSMAGSSISAGPRSGSGTSQTTSRARSSRRVGSGHSYTLIYDEPH